MGLFVMRLGVLLIVLSCPIWLVVLGAPLVFGATGRAAAWSGAALLTAESIFWLGLALVGKPMWIEAKRQGWRQVPKSLWRRFLYGDTTLAALDNEPR